MKLILALVALSLAGCATEASKQKLADAHHAAQAEYVKTVAESQHPIFELVGVAGQTISLSGVAALRVYSGDANKAAQFQPAPVQQNEFVEVLKVVKDTALGIGPFWLGGKVMNSLTNVANNGKGAVTTTTNTNNNQQSNTTTSNANQANQANVSNANQANQANQSNQANPVNVTQGAGSVNGSGSASNPVSTTSTSNTSTTPTTHGTCTTGSC